MKPAKLRRAEVDDSKAIKARSAYLEMFGTLEDATAWQEIVLGSRKELLPPCAVVVKNGGQATAAYWRWLAAMAEVWS